MKVSNWRKTIVATIMAAGIWIPGVAQAVNIPLLDASFEDYGVGSVGYAYAKNPIGEYRPTSAWVDDMSSPYGLYTQDDHNSNWLYTTSYADTNGRPAPKSAGQAMHGHHNYNGQITSAVFQAGVTYTFSIWAQNDVNLNDQNGAYLYIFDGTVPFDQSTALVGPLITAINQRGALMDSAQSQANWTQISTSYLVPQGSPAIGHLVGVGFFGRRDTAFDDAVLSDSTVPEPASIILIGASGLSLLGIRRRR